jgi:hypothetical protein
MFLISKYLAYKDEDGAIEVFLLIAIFTLASIFRLIFKRFGELFGVYLKPGSAISIAENILEFQERLQPAPVESSPCLVKLW